MQKEPDKSSCRAGERLEGDVIINTKGGPMQHGGIRVSVTGSVQMRLSEKAVGVFEALFINVKPVPLLSELAEARININVRKHVEI